MAASKKPKKVVQKEFPQGRYVGQVENPDRYYEKNPAWNFNTCDPDLWPFTEENVGPLFWKEILPRLQEWEKLTWGEILLDAKKFNHSIDVTKLNRKAQDRFAERQMEQESVISLRLTGTHRIYGYITGMVFFILWFDKDHGDNETCVCRSRKKHT